MDKKEIVRLYLENTKSNAEFIELWNERCTYCDMADYIFSNDDNFLDDEFSSASDAIKSAHNGNYSYSDDFVVVNGVGNLDSFNYYTDSQSPFDMEILIDWLCENNKLDEEDLQEEFIESFCEETGEDSDKIVNLVDEYLSEEGFDFVCDDWDELVDYLEGRLTK